MKFFERVRAELARYAEGVHRLRAPAKGARVRDGELASFYASWDGGELFGDAYSIRPAAECVEEDGLLVFGEMGAGDRLAIDGKGRVLRLEEDSGEVLIEGTSFARWLEGVMVADAIIYDREGEFQDGAFEGEELTPGAAAKREKKALRADPGAPAPAWRLARALERGGDQDGARRLEDVVEAAPEFAWAWFDLGRLRRAGGDAAGAEEAHARAAEAAAAQGGEHAAFFAAHAARAAAERGDEAARAKRAARALELDGECARGLRKAAQARADEEAPDEARELAELALALQPRDLEAAELKRRLGGRR